MKGHSVRYIIRRLLEYNLDAEFQLIVDGKIQDYEFAIGDSEGVEPRNCKSVAIFNPGKDKNNEEPQKFRINIIDFIPHSKKINVGKYGDGTDTFLGDVVKYNNEDWFISYRYGEIMLKQVGCMVMPTLKGFKEGDFSRTEKTNVIGAGNDWLIVGYTNEPMYDRLKHINNIQLV